MTALTQDLRYGWRMLAKSPGFSAVAALALALGIGANTAIFSVVRAVLLRALPYREPDRIILVWTDNPAIQVGFNDLPPSNADMKDWQSQNHVFERLAAFASRNLNLSAAGEPERVGGAQVTAELIPLLGVEPSLGRVFTADEDQPGKNRVVLLSHGLWQRRFGSDPSLVGKSITLDGIGYTVIGIMPPGFGFPRAAELPAAYNFAAQSELWVPLALSAEQWNRRDWRFLVAMARLKPAVSLPQAQAEMSAIARRLAQDHPDSNAGWIVKVVPLEEQIVGKTRPALLVLLGAVGFVLLIACANVANLLLARATGRRKEIAIRAALGAGRFRVIRQLLVESILLALLGGALGLLLANSGVKLLVAASPANIPRLAETQVDGWVLGFSASVSLLTGVLFGLVPAIQSSKANLNEVLRAAAAPGAGTSRFSASGLLVIWEMALALVLLVGAGLMIRSFWRLLAVDPGFNPQAVVAMDISLSGAKYSTEDKQAAFFGQSLERIGALPGVRSAGAISRLPLAGAEQLNFLGVEGQPPVPRGQEPVADERTVTPGYFQALGVPLVRGRLFTERDVPGQPRVVIVNETLARRFFPREDPIGKRIKFGRVESASPWRAIVGVVRNVKSSSLEAAPRPQVYRPFLQNTQNEMTILIRAEGDPLKLVAAARAEIGAVDPNQPIDNVRTMEQVVSQSVARRRFQMLLLGLFATVALVLTMVGLYGVISYSVSQRTHEIGIRMALGAQQGDVLRMVVGQGLRLAMFGLGAGLAAALLLTRVLSSMLYGVSPTDPATFAGVSFLLAVVALAASYFPARRATKVDPMVALRHE